MNLFFKMLTFYNFIYFLDLNLKYLLSDLLLLLFGVVGGFLWVGLLVLVFWVFLPCPFWKRKGVHDEHLLFAFEYDLNFF